MNNNSYDTIIVGAGIAGLTSAAYLAREGQKVLLIEKNKECGGLVNSFSRDGFTFEAGVRALEDAGIIFPMLHDLGIELETIRSKVSLGIGSDIIEIDSIDSLADYKSLLIKYYPDSKDEIKNFIIVVKRIMKHMDVLYGIENPIFKDLKRDTKYILKKLLPWFPKFIFTINKINKMNVPVELYLEKIISDKSLRNIIAQHFFKATPAFFALSYFSLYLDYFYPKGGVGKLAEAVYNKVIDFGGFVINKTTITHVDANLQEVQDSNNRIYKYKNLIWAADLKTFYQNTNIKGLPDKIINEFQETKEKICNCRGNDTVFTLYLEIDEPKDTFESIANGHFFYTPSNKGIGEVYTSELRYILNNWQSISKSEILAWLDRYTELNTFEISIPVLKDPSLAPVGKTGMIISLLAEYELFEKVKEDGWYDEFKKELETRIIETLAKSIFPMLSDNVIKQFSFTPISIKDRIGSSEGAIIGWSFEKEVPVVHKLQYSDNSVLTPIPNIYQIGQWAYSPAGVPMSILTGKLAVNRIIGKKW